MIPEDADGLFKLTNIIVKKLESAPLDDELAADLQEQLNQKRQQALLSQQKEDNTADLLSQLIDDILAEPLMLEKEPEIIPKRLLLKRWYH